MIGHDNNTIHLNYIDIKATMIVNKDNCDLCVNKYDMS